MVGSARYNGSPVIFIGDYFDSVLKCTVYGVGLGSEVVWLPHYLLTEITYEVGA